MKLAPYQYIHVLDKNKSISRIEFGPLNFIKQEHEEITTGNNPIDMIILKPFTYARIMNPVVMEKNAPKIDKNGQIVVKYGEEEIRTEELYSDPFPLYPGETLKKIDKLTIVPRNHALHVKAIRDFKDKEGNMRNAEDEWLIQGPVVYIPKIEEEIVSIHQPIIIQKNTALKLRAKNETKDINDQQRQAGEEWLVTKPGMYLLGINEINLGEVGAYVITEKKALHLTALKEFKDIYGNPHKAGEEWLVTNKTTSTHIPDVNEEVVKEVDLTILNSNQYCYILNPLEKGVNLYGKKILKIGPTSFFLNTGEEIEGGIQKNYILSSDEALLLKAKENFKEEDKVHEAGERWMIKGPCSFVPPVEVEVIETRKSIPLDKIEGIYVRDTQSGAVRAVIGSTYMLQPHEDLWEMPLNQNAEELLKNAIPKGSTIDKTKLITFKCPFNGACQIYDYKQKQSRVVFGPNLVMLSPDEQFTISYLSGGCPKQPGRVKTLFILMGPTFSTDMVTVETADHARLELRLAYNWQYEVDKSNNESSTKIFNVRDFIGDFCSFLASKIRGLVASLAFDDFHKNSAKKIRTAIFGIDSEGHVRDSLKFDTNNISITNCDIQSVEPVDPKTRDSLQNTVTQAIEITTNKQQQEAKREADKKEQAATGLLEKQKLENSASFESAKKDFLELKIQSEQVETKGAAIAESKAKSAALTIKAENDLKVASLLAEAKKIKEEAEMELEKKKKDLELEHKTSLSNLEISKAEKLSKIEADKFKKIMDSIGKQTLVEISNAGPEMQAQMLQSLGLKGYVLMDSKNPVNLFTAATGMLGGLGLGDKKREDQNEIPQVADSEDS